MPNTMRTKRRIAKNRANLRKSSKQEKRIYSDETRKTGSEIRVRRHLQIVDKIEHVPVPHCSHGPCLLFTDSTTAESWFACAVFRSRELCGFRVKIADEGKATDIVETRTAEVEKAALAHPIEEYGIAFRNFNCLMNRRYEPSWCSICVNFVHCPHQHPVKGPYNKLPNPLELLAAITEDAGEAQYWFMEDTIEIFENTMKREKIDSILCLGTPSLFERFRRKGANAFLLDFDDRLSRFYSANEFARFSMLVCHFFISKSRQYLEDFFRKSEKLICACDPPFGVHVSALMRTITTLKTVFSQQKSESTRSFDTVLFLPYFVGKHLREFPDFSMVDFKVTYGNHRDYSKPAKSIVRMFTDLPNRSFTLPVRLGYRFCAECDRFVTSDNQHCWKCSACTSVDGTSFIHCDRCGRCVRKKYKHCRDCDFCHLKGRCTKKS